MCHNENNNSQSLSYKKPVIPFIYRVTFSLIYLLYCFLYSFHCDNCTSLWKGSLHTSYTNIMSSYGSTTIQKQCREAMQKEPKVCALVWNSTGNNHIYTVLKYTVYRTLDLVDRWPKTNTEERAPHILGIEYSSLRDCLLISYIGTMKPHGFPCMLVSTQVLSFLRRLPRIVYICVTTLICGSFRLASMGIVLWCTQKGWYLLILAPISIDLLLCFWFVCVWGFHHCLPFLDQSRRHEPRARQAFHTALFSPASLVVGNTSPHSCSQQEESFLCSKKKKPASDTLVEFCPCCVGRKGGKKRGATFPRQKQPPANVEAVSVCRCRLPCQTVYILHSAGFPLIRNMKHYTNTCHSRCICKLDFFPQKYVLFGGCAGVLCRSNWFLCGQR